jgi:hypothetical protein
MLEEEPLHWCAPQNMWLMTLRRRLEQSLRDMPRLPAPYRIVEEQDLVLEEKKSKSIVMMDPPRHDRLRSLVSRAFTVRRRRCAIVSVSWRSNTLAATRRLRTSRCLRSVWHRHRRRSAWARHIARLAEAMVAMVLVDPADPSYPERCGAVATLDDYSR